MADGHGCSGETQVIETTITIPITANILPDGNLWEADGSCWQARVDAREPKGWRWFPMNWTAFGKGEPTGEMVAYFWPAGHQICGELGA